MRSTVPLSEQGFHTKRVAMSALLCRETSHQMLNARPQYVRKEAKVIAQAGLPGMITIATNMAGRGVDILMGGEPQGLAQMALEQLVFAKHLSGEASTATACKC